MILSRREVTAPGGERAEVGSPCCQHTHGTRGAKCLFLHGCPGNTSLTIVARARKTATKLEGRKKRESPISHYIMFHWMNRGVQQNVYCSAT